MLILQTKQMTIKTKYLVNNNGTWMYQRRIPLRLRKFFQDKQHIRLKLTGSRSSMSAEIIQHAKDTDALFNDLKNKTGTDRTQAEAEALLAYYGLRPGAGNEKSRIPNRYDEFPQLVDVAEYFAYKTDKNLLTESDELARTLLTKPMPLMLSGCLDVYFANHQKGALPKFRIDTQKHFKHVFEVLGDMGVDSLNRQHARRYVEARRFKVSTNSVAREISTIKAVLNTVIREKELGISNPFLSLVIPDLGKDAKVRSPFKIDELKKMVDACLATPSDPQVILLLCILTGARLSEVTGLRRQDVSLDSAIPCIKLIEYNERTLKTKNSKRVVPLVPLAADTLKKHLSAHQAEVVFPAYSDGIAVNGNSASVTIADFIRRLGIKDKTTHNTRHTMRDLLLHSGVRPHLIDAIGGWGSNSVGDGYGEGYKPEQKYEALMMALAPVLN